MPEPMLEPARIDDVAELAFGNYEDTLRPEGMRLSEFANRFNAEFPARGPVNNGKRSSKDGTRGIRRAWKRTDHGRYYVGRVG